MARRNRDKVRYFVVKGGFLDDTAYFRIGRYGEMFFVLRNGEHAQGQARNYNLEYAEQNWEEVTYAFARRQMKGRF